MTNDYILRPANINDVEFLAETIIEAEKSGSDILSYSTIFGLDKEEVKRLIIDMLEEEADGCDVSISSFSVAEKDGELVAAVSCWQEGSAGISSTVLKGNLLSCCLKPEAMQKAQKVNKIISELSVEPVPGCLFLSAGYVKPEHRGQGLASKLIELRISEAMKNPTPPNEIYSHVFDTNTSSLRSCEKMGFNVVETHHSDSKEIRNLLPSDSKVVVMKKL